MNLRLINLSKIFYSIRGKIKAVNNVNLEIQAGEFFVILGPSGCGKSTLLNLIAGLEKPTSGEIYFGKNLIASKEKNVFIPPKDRNIAMVFQNYALYPHLSVFENIAFPLKIQKMDKDKIKKEVEKVAEMLNIKDLLTARPAELSGGQKQRVAIARALVRKPSVFLLDEPLSNLDAQLRISARAEIKSLQKELGITTIYVTHDQVEAMSLGKRIAVMRDGKIEQVGTPEELYKNPKNIFIAQFIGRIPMNLFVVDVVEDKSSAYGLIKDLKIKIPDEKRHLIKDKKIVIGIRPEDLFINPEKADYVFLGETKLVESWGREKLIYVKFGEYSFKILSKDETFGKKIKIGFNQRNLYFFENIESRNQICMGLTIS